MTMCEIQAHVNVDTRFVSLIGISVRKSERSSSRENDVLGIGEHSSQKRLFQPLMHRERNHKGISLKVRSETLLYYKKRYAIYSPSL